MSEAFYIHYYQNYYQKGDNIHTFLILTLFAAGLILIVRGGDRFVDAASWMASVSGIPPFVIGATVVSVATTLPELLVSLFAAFSGQADMAAGNAVGSVTANTALILAMSAVFMPGPVERSGWLTKSLLLILAVALLWITGLSGYLTPFGCMGLLLLFGFFLYENLRQAKASRTAEYADTYTSDRGAAAKNIFFFLLGAGEIILGSRLLVDNGSLIARDLLHIDERVVSLTLVAVGTSLPELVTAVSSIIKRRPAITAGNILGANIIDTLLILPLCALAQGGTMPLSRGSLWLDIPFCLASVLIMLLPVILKSRFYRAQGVISVLLYIGYTAVLFIAGI